MLSYLKAKYQINFQQETSVEIKFLSLFAQRKIIKRPSAAIENLFYITQINYF